MTFDVVKIFKGPPVTPKPSIIPEGWEVVHDGVVQKGMKAWNSDIGLFSDPFEIYIGDPVQTFYCVIKSKE